MMMAGRLETNLEEELKKDIEKPEFMTKPQGEWSEDEVKLAKEYEKKLAQVFAFVCQLLKPWKKLKTYFANNSSQSFSVPI